MVTSLMVKDDVIVGGDVIMSATSLFERHLTPVSSSSCASNQPLWIVTSVLCCS